jgi:NAD(P)-dependent dehydrogenase (short-subunit alcohol dehydrogenase family)
MSGRRGTLVTGCSTGFGRETALHLAGRGFTVYATLRDLSGRAALEAAAAERGVKLRVLCLDVTDPESVEAAVATVVQETGGVAAAVNYAGLVVRGYFEDLLDREIRQVFETNVFGTMAVVRAVLPHMRSAGRGRIVVVTSVAGRIGAPTATAYSATRFAQEGFAESLAQEAAPLGVRVILVEPGIVRTERWAPGRDAGVRAREGPSPYREWFPRAERLFDQAMASSPTTASDVARAVERALRARRPRLRYVVGRRAALVIALRRHIPGEIFERLYFGEILRRVTGRRIARQE